MIRIGTSGWNYPHWRGSFYPRDLAPQAWLEYYRERFDTVELNKSFYNLPDPEQFAAWRDAVPQEFLFAVKASRYITHMKKLKSPAEAPARFLDHVRALGDRLGPLLFQLPPRWRANPDRLETFLDALPQGLRYVFEFRDESWMTESVTGLLRSHGAAFCIYELAGYHSPLEITADFAYVRLHGPGAAYEGSYDDGALAGWARWARERNGEELDVYIYFDNDQHGYAPENAMRLQSLVTGAG
ncbi:MAG: DUF72 domain-containing protein [Spirochaetaceae bacterium]